MSDNPDGIIKKIMSLLKDMPFDEQKRILSKSEEELAKEEHERVTEELLKGRELYKEKMLKWRA